MTDSQLIDSFQRARKDTELAVIEGAQAIKHAVRFGAEIKEYITYDISSVTTLLEELAEDVKDVILASIKEVSEVTFKKLSPQPPRTGLIALAERRNYKISDIEQDKPIVFLEDPRDLENIGAVIRVSAAANAGAVVISGPADIWHPAVIRGAAGLHWALPVFSLPEASSFLQRQGSRQKIALDPTGEDINQTTVPKNAILIFGTERHGISKKLLATSDQIVRLPMKAGVSSLNLATSVAATLYHL